MDLLRSDRGCFCGILEFPSGVGAGLPPARAADPRRGTGPTYRVAPTRVATHIEAVAKRLITIDMLNERIVNRAAINIEQCVSLHTLRKIYVFHPVHSYRFR